MTHRITFNGDSGRLGHLSSLMDDEKRAFFPKSDIYEFSAASVSSLTPLIFSGANVQESMPMHLM